MNLIPFRNIEEAKESAKLLCRAFAFYEINLPEEPSNIGLQQTQELMAQSFRCVGWKDLTRRVELQGSVTYLDDRGDCRSAHVNLAERLQGIIGVHIPLETLRAAFGIAAVGCTAQARSEARRFFSNCPAATAAQWGKLMQVAAAFSYHTRYNNHRTEFDVRMLEYSRQVATAEILGTPVPKKPRRRKSVT